MKKQENSKKKMFTPVSILGGIAVGVGYFMFSPSPSYSVDMMTPGLKLNNKDEQTASLIKAAEESTPENLKKLIRNGADVNAKDSTGRTALMRAAELGQTENVEILIDAGADIHAKDNKEWTALMYAEWDDHTDIIKLLKDAGEK